MAQVEPWVVALVDQMITEITNDGVKLGVAMLAEEGYTVTADSIEADLIGVGVGAGIIHTLLSLNRHGLLRRTPDA